MPVITGLIPKISRIWRKLKSITEHNSAPACTTRRCMHVHDSSVFITVPVGILLISFLLFPDQAKSSGKPCCLADVQANRHRRRPGHDTSFLIPLDTQCDKLLSWHKKEPRFNRECRKGEDFLFHNLPSPECTYLSVRLFKNILTSSQMVIQHNSVTNCRT